MDRRLIEDRSSRFLLIAAFFTKVVDNDCRLENLSLKRNLESLQILLMYLIQIERLSIIDWVTIESFRKSLWGIDVAH